MKPLLSLFLVYVGSELPFVRLLCLVVFVWLILVLFLAPGFHVVWCRFRMLRRHMAYNSSVHELARVHSLLRVVSAGAPGHGPVYLLLSSALSLGFSWYSDLCVWLRPGLPALCQVSNPFQFFREPVWGAWRTKVAGDLSSRAGFSVWQVSGFSRFFEAFILASLERRGLRAFAWHSIWEGVWNGFLLSSVRGEIGSLSFLWRS